MFEEFIKEGCLLIVYKSATRNDSVYLEQVTITNYDGKKYLAGKRIRHEKHFFGGCSQLIDINDIGSIIQIGEEMPVFDHLNFFQRIWYILTGKF